MVVQEEGMTGEDHLVSTLRIASAVSTGAI